MKILLIAYDNGSHISFPPLNMIYLHDHLLRAGHHVGIWQQDIHHGPDEVLTTILDQNDLDIVGIGACAGYYQHAKLKSLAQAVNWSKNRSKFHFVLGGHGPAGAPEYFQSVCGCDSVVIGDGEDGMDQIIAGAKGIIHGAPCTRPDGPMEALQHYPLDLYRLIRWPTSARTDFCFPILSSRGCKFKCSFCYRMREGFYLRPVEAIIDEMQWLHDAANVNHFQFADELLMADEKRTAAICEAILTKLKFPVKWDCNGRLNYASPEVLHFMKKSGCEYINYGVESLDQSILNGMNKGLTVDRIEQGIKDTVRAGMSPGINIIWGFPEDTLENLKAAVDFIMEYDPGHELRTIRPVTPYPGCDLYRVAIETGLLADARDFYAKHTNSDALTVNFTDIPDAEFHQHLLRANLMLFDHWMGKHAGKVTAEAREFYANPHRGFRGWRTV